ncbi:MAG: hypothetical protein SGILL_005637 [Bacillariaceae sp.]
MAPNVTVTLQNEQTVQVLTGSVEQINQILEDNNSSNTTSPTTEFSILPSSLRRESVDELLEILNSYPHLDEDPDTVDGMPTYEVFVESPELYSPSNKIRDSDPNFVPKRKELRAKLQKILQPYLTDIITPFVQQHVSACQDKEGDRTCTPCYSLIRRYRHGDRVSHGTHHDGHALATVVVSLSDYLTEYKGGLYVSTGYGQEREFLALNKGDAVVHQSTLLHGVQVHDIDGSRPEETRRWSWILWFRDSTTCEDHSHEWFAECSEQGNVLCQQLHSTKVANVPGIPQNKVADAILHLNKKAAEGGAGMAAVKMARAYLHQLPSKLPLDVEKALYYYDLAIQSNNPDGYYGKAAILLQSVSTEQAASSKNDYNMDTRVVEAVRHLEAAAKLHHPYSQFNLGMVHTYGYATNVIDGAIAAKWFVQSGLPEGYFVAAQQAMAVGDQARYQRLGEKAHALGFMAPWRAQARDATGSGGAGGVSLNLAWPIAADGRQPPKL